MADQYLAAHNPKRSSKEVIKRDSTRVGVKSSHSEFSLTSTLKCFLYNRVEPERGRKKYYKSTRHAVTCYQCGKILHEKRLFRNTLRPQAVPRGGGNTPRPTSQSYRVNCTVQVGNYRMMAKRRTKIFVVQTGEKIKVMRNDACLSNENMKCMLFATGKEGENVVKFLRETGCNGVIDRKELVKEGDFTGSMGYEMAIDRTLKEASIAETKVDTPYYTGVTQAICLLDPLFDLVIGNVPGTRNSDDPVSVVEACAAGVAEGSSLEGCHDQTFSYQRRDGSDFYHEG